jgi:hypothetical protein
MTSRAWVPIDPVLPRITTRRISTPWRCHVEELLAEAKDLRIGQIVDIDPNISKDAASNLPVVLFDIRDELMRGIRLTRAVSKDQDGLSAPKLLRQGAPHFNVVGVEIPAQRSRL